jgi:hypothetical protein
MATNLRDVAQEVVQEMRRQIRRAKIETIRKAWDDLFFVLVGEEVFKRIPDARDYSSFENELRMLLEKTERPHPIIIADLFPVTDLPDNVGDLLARLGKLSSVDYAPPKNGKNMAIDLLRLQGHYMIDLLIPEIEMVIDLSLCKLIRAVCVLHAEVNKKGHRTLSPIKAKQMKTASRKTVVLEAFYKIDNKRAKGKSLNWIVEDIKKIIEINNETVESNERMAIPSARTIKRYLEHDEKAMNDHCCPAR